MADGNDNKVTLLTRLAAVVLGLPWPEVLGDLWKYGRKAMRGLSNEGMYEVIEYETTLEIHDPKGRKATLKKREKVRYLQDNIIAYQDQAWGDGEILIDYSCSPGKPVDRYRSGFKTHILISLQTVKNRGDVDEFNVQWNIRQGFLISRGFWANEINHRTKQLAVMIVFPKERPPLRVWILEKNLQRTKILGDNDKRQLPDGRCMVSWKKSKPRLYEQYILNWEW